MKKFLALLAVATFGVMSLHAQTAEPQEPVNDGIAKTWELRLNGDYEVSFWGSGDPFGFVGCEDGSMVNIGVGYNFNSNWYLGIASGYNINMGVTEHVKYAPKSIPLLLDVTRRWNGKGGKWSFFLEGRGGYMFSVAKDEVFSNGTVYKYPDAWMIDIQPGVYYRVRPNIDLKLSLGYLHIDPKDDTPDCCHNTNSLNIMLGVNFRKAVKAPVRTEVVEEAPVVAPEPEPVVAPAPEPVQIVETTTPEQKQLGEREVVIHYLIRKHNILPEKDALLEEMAEFVKTHKTSHIVLKSYADKGTGNYQLNQMYSRNRMNEVKKHLVEQYGIPAEKIDASYYGDTVQPFAENDLNRCSIITVKEVE